MTEDKISSATAALNLDKNEPPKVQGPERPSIGDSIAAMMPELSPGRSINAHMTLDETLADLKKSPLFMDELDLENEDVAALQALAYEGTPLENAANFKEQGNECFREKRWSDAKEFYGKGIAILSQEESKRKRRAAGLPALPTAASAATVPTAQQKNGQQQEAITKEDKAQVDALDAKQSVGKEFKLPQDQPKPPKEESTPEEEEEDPAEIPKQLSLLEQLHVNRAACHLELRNYRSCTLDCAHALRLNPRNVKAYYRSSRSLLAVSRVEEAQDSCTRGLEIDPTNKALLSISAEITKKQREISAQQAKQSALTAKQNREKKLLETALAARNISLRSTGKPPDMEDAHVCLVPDPSDPESSLAFPTLLLYPLHYESDFIKTFNETESLEQHFGYVFPLPWDREGVYGSSAAVECFMETKTGGLVKVGKKVPLLKVLSGGNVEVVDELLKIFVVPKGKADAWVREFKERNKEGKNWKGK